MPRFQVIGNPERFITNLALITKQHGERELILRLKQLTRHNLQHLLPPGCGGSDDDLRNTLKVLVRRRLSHILGSQERTNRFLTQESPDDDKADRRASRRLNLAHDMPKKKFGGGKRLSQEQQREVARASFDRNREVERNEIKEWDKQMKRKNREGLG